MSEHTVEVTEANFGDVVEKSEVPVLLDFWAEWCGPCQAMAPVLDDVAGELEGKVKIGKVNIDNERDLAVKYNIRSIPTLVVFKDGEEANRQVGAVQKPQVLNLLETVLS